MSANSIFLSGRSSLFSVISSNNYQNLTKHLVANPDSLMSKIKLVALRFGLLIVRDLNLKNIRATSVKDPGTKTDSIHVENDLNFSHIETYDGLIYQIPDSNAWSNSAGIVLSFALKQEILSFPVFQRSDLNSLQEIGCVKVLNRSRFNETLLACQLGILNCAKDGFYSPIDVKSDSSQHDNEWILLLRYFKMRISFKIRTKFLRNSNKPDWYLGYRRFGETQNEISIIQNTNMQEFIADPFVFRQNNRDYIFCEEMKVEHGRGLISVLELNGLDTSVARPVIKEEFHMSFPYIFEFESKIFMVPETSESKSIRIYECLEFPYHWKFRSEALSDIFAADPMIFKHDGLWWLICNTDRTGVNSFCLELSVYYSTNPLACDWVAHPNNPVINGSITARNAGLIYEDGRILRLGQRQGFLEYGAGLETLEILKLNREEYQEALVVDAKVESLKLKISGHHYHRNSTIEVFDIKDLR